MVRRKSSSFGSSPAAYHILRDGVPYRELTGAHFDSRDRTKLTKQLLRRLADIGVLVDIRTAP